MCGGLREYWGLAELSGLANTEQAAEFGRGFRERMSGVNRELQLAAAQAQPAEYQSLDAQRIKLYEVY